MTFSHATHLSDFQQIARAWTERSFQRESSAFCHVIFTQGAPLFSDFQQNARVCPKQRFQPEISTFCPFCTGRTTFQRLQLNALVSAHQQVLCWHWAHHFLSFSDLVQHFLAIFTKVHESLQNSSYIPRSAGFVIFAPGAPLSCHFQQSTRDCPKQRFQPEISTFCHFRTGHTTL